MIVKAYHGVLSLEEIRELASRNIFTFNSRAVMCRKHALYAYEKARRVFEKGTNIAKNLHIEMMLILTGKRQIKEALTLASAEGTESFVAISPHNFQLPYDEDEKLLTCSLEKAEYLGIEVPQGYLDKLCELALENSALLELQR